MSQQPSTRKRALEADAPAAPAVGVGEAEVDEFIKDRGIRLLPALPSAIPWDEQEGAGAESIWARFAEITEKWSISTGNFVAGAALAGVPIDGVSRTSVTFAEMMLETFDECRTPEDAEAIALAVARHTWAHTARARVRELGMVRRWARERLEYVPALARALVVCCVFRLPLQRVQYVHPSGDYIPAPGDQTAITRFMIRGDHAIFQDYPQFRIMRLNNVVASGRWKVLREMANVITDHEQTVRLPMGMLAHIDGALAHVARAQAALGPVAAAHMRGIVNAMLAVLIERAAARVRRGDYYSLPAGALLWREGVESLVDVTVQ